MSEKAADDARSSVEDVDRAEQDDARPRIPQGVVDAAEQLNRGENVARSELLEALDAASESDE